jgi:hypothetical protein
VEDTGSEYRNTSAESDEEESDEDVGGEVENWDTTSVAKVCSSLEHFRLG